MKRLTLDETWTECIKMWRWVVKRWQADSMILVGDLKGEYLNKKHIGPDEIKDDCFFCEYANKNSSTSCQCASCPGVMVDPEFDCKEKGYSWNDAPDKFLQKLLSLNRKRKQK